MASEIKAGGVSWRHGVPVADAFDDPYYSLDDGLAESRFVFLQGTNAIARAKTRERLVIGETGFGTGLNFLATWQAWRDQNVSARLTFVSAEAFPLSCEDLSRAHAHFPELASLAGELRSVWPPSAAGFHPRHFDNGCVSLLLLFGSAEQAFAELDASVDAWYLDGFAPAKNPEMWTDNLFSQLARLSAPEATLATFTAAGFVRRGLEAHGFDIQKTPGFGRKRERLVGQYSDNSQPADGLNKTSSTRTWATVPKSETNRIAVIGGGIGGASTLYALKQRGLKPILIKSPEKNETASALPAAILAPRFMLDNQPERSFFNAAYAFAITHPVFADAFADIGGIVFPASNPEDRARFRSIHEEYGWSEDWMDIRGSNLFLPKGGTVDPKRVISSMTDGVEHITANIDRLERTGNRWILLDAKGQTVCETETVVLAAGIGTSGLLACSGLAGTLGGISFPDIRPNAGQVEIVETSALSGINGETLSFGGYVSASLANSAGNEFRTVGSTFEPLSEVPSDLKTDKAARDKILRKLSDHTGVTLDQRTIHSSWAGLRATVADHLPFAGPIPDWDDLKKVCVPLGNDAKAALPRAPELHDGLYCLFGLGSKGFQYGPLLGDYIAAMICGEPSPIPVKMVEKLHPSRSFVRAIIRRRR